MKHSLHTLLVLCVLAAPVVAQRGGHGGGGGTGMGNSSNVGSHGNSSNHGQPTDTGKKSASGLLSQNSKLTSKVQALLPAGTSLEQAASGFKNLGQFVAAVHVSHNLGIPFDQLKAKMTGTNPESLGKAIQDLKPLANSKAEAKKANKQAKQDIDESEES